jgi:hypothetical protein
MFRCLRRFFADQRGGASVMLVLMMIPMVGAMGMAVEGASFYFTGRAMQNAADSAALAAAQNTCDVSETCHTTGATKPTFVQEAAAVATNYGFTTGGDTTVSTKRAACPDAPTQPCYWVKITRVVPVNMLRIIGFRGDTVLSSGAGRGQMIAALSVASPKANPSTLCLLSLAWGGSSTVAIDTHGSPKADMGGCSIGTNGSARCTGSNGLNSDATLAVGTSSGCSASTSGDKSGQPVIADPYSALASNIPTRSCGSSPGVKSDFPQTATSNPLSGALTLPSVQQYCGNVNLTGSTTITPATGGTVIVIWNGSLNIPSGMTLTGGSGGVTIIFAGAPVSGPAINPGPTYTLTGGGTIDVSSIRSGVWSGVAIYTDPSLTDASGTVDYSAAGNSPTWKISGLIYVPHADIQFSGIVSKASNGLDCFGLVDDTFSSNGTTKILEFQTQCAQQGLIPPSGGNPIRQALVR